MILTHFVPSLTLTSQTLCHDSDVLRWVTMFKKIARKNRMHYGAAMALAMRDQTVQFSAVTFLCGICLLYGQVWLALALLAVITATDVSIVCLTRQRRPFYHLSKDARLFGLLGLCAAKVVLYLSPALILITLPPLVLKLLGIIWLMGAQTYITQMWSRIPLFLYVMLAPAFGMMIVAFFRLSEAMHSLPSGHHWVIETSLLGVYVFASFNTLHQHATRESALIAAEQAASSRLAQLEESQRLDPLTGLLNRGAFDDALTSMLDDHEDRIGVFLLDINSFKPINDTYSHEAGDAVLLAIARRINAHFGENGLAARMGGDEFICAMPQRGTDDDILTFAETLGDAISQGIKWNARELRVTASIGVAITGSCADAPCATVPALSAAADQAMFRAKSSPNGRPVIYRAHLFRPRMTADDKQSLVDSISDGTVRPYYQPKVHLSTGRIIGFEALARWDHPTRGQRQPNEFIEQINGLGLQGDFMNAMAEQVFRDVQAMLTIGLDPGQVSINVSEVALATFSGRRDLHRIVAAHPQVAKHITFEITEDVFIARAAETIQASIETFRSLGVRISLDDFGTGFASFDHLRQLDFDELKIDTSFVAGLGQDSTSQVLVQGFLDIASGLGVGVVAEGVETESQRQELTNMGCVVAQGYLFSPAIPFADATNMLEQQKAA